MRLALADVKKSFMRRGGDAYIVPHLLRPGDLQGELVALVELHETLLGQDRERFPHDRPAEIIGDHRLARGITTSLGDWYAWEPRAWPGPAGADEAAALEAAGVRSSPQLRLALYDVVQAEHGGYLPTQERERFMTAFAERLHVRKDTLDALLEQDSDEHAQLRRVVPSAPTPAALAARYNWRAVEAVLSAASSVTWTLPPVFAAASGTTLGTLLKRICFLARRMGVDYDAEYAESYSAGEGQPLPLVAERRVTYNERGMRTPAEERQGPINVLLYGPQEVFGGPTRYGDRLARLCRLILGLNRSEDEHQYTPRAAAGLRGEATVYLRSQPFRFALDERLLRLVLPRGEADTRETAAAAASAFDSVGEQQLFEEFAALEREQATRGWHCEREPEPLLSGETIYIPDFTLSRGTRRVYLELAGYWSTEYRERKSRKLLSLAEHADLLVVAPEDARAAFRALEGVVPCVWYTRRATARQLLAALTEHWDDFAERRTSSSTHDVLDDLENRGVLPAAELNVKLHVYDRTELARVVEELTATSQAHGTLNPTLVDGLGLVSPRWLEGARARIDYALARQSAPVSPGALADRLTGDLPELRLASDLETAVEALALICGFEVDRSDLFHPVIRPPGIPFDSEAAHASRSADSHPKRAQPREARRRRQNEKLRAIPIPWDGSLG
jgi:predicted nuclease of restriction endonuclease-like RecB superfamily